MLSVGWFPGKELGSTTLTAQGVHDKHTIVFASCLFCKSKILQISFG